MWRTQYPPPPGYTRITSAQRTNRKVHPTKKVDTTYSSQIGNIKEGGPHVLARRSEPIHLFFSSPVREKGGFSWFTLSRDQKGLVTWESSSNNVTWETTPFSLPTRTSLFKYSSFLWNTPWRSNSRSFVP